MSTLDGTQLLQFVAFPVQEVQFLLHGRHIELERYDPLLQLKHKSVFEALQEAQSWPHLKQIWEEMSKTKEEVQAEQ